MSVLKRLGGVAAVAGLAAVGVAAMPHNANAWWSGGYRVGIWVPPVVVAPPVYAPPPVAYIPRRRLTIPRRAAYGCPRTGKALLGARSLGLND